MDETAYLVTLCSFYCNSVELMVYKARLNKKLYYLKIDNTFAFSTRNEQHIHITNDVVSNILCNFATKLHNVLPYL